MKLLFAAIIIFIISGCKDNVVNHYIVVPATHDTVNTKCDSTDWGNDDDQDGHGHHHHRKPHLKEKED